MLVKEVMKKPIVVEHELTLEQASKIMSKNKISSLLVVEKEKVKGIITQKDLVDNFGNKMMVSQIMSKNVVSVREDDKTSKAINLIKKNKVSILPVLDYEDKLVGVVHVKDLLNENGGDDFLLD